MAASSVTPRADPLALRLGSGAGVLALLIGGGQDVGWRPDLRGDLVDGRDLRHPLAIALLAPRQACPELVLGVLGLLLCLGPQCIRPHHDPLAVAGEHQRIVLISRVAFAVLIERLEVNRGPERQLLDLALAELCAGDPADRLGGIIERSARDLERDQPPDAVRVLLLGQIQRPVGDIQVLLAPPPVRQPPDPDLAKDALKRPAMTALDRPVRDAGRVHHLIQTRLADRAQLELVLKQRAQKLAALSLQQILQLGVLKPVGVHTRKRAHDRIKPFPRAGKRIPGRRHATRLNPGETQAEPPNPRGSSPASSPQQLPLTTPKPRLHGCFTAPSTSLRESRTR